MTLKGTYFRQAINRWRLRQQPSWSWRFLAEKLGCSETWLYKIGNPEYNSRPGPELAYKIELLTNNEIQMIDVLLDPEAQEKIKKEMQANVN